MKRFKWDHPIEIVLPILRNYKQRPPSRAHIFRVLDSDINSANFVVDSNTIGLRRKIEYTIMSNSLRFPSSAAISNHEGVQVCSSRILHFRDLTPFFAFVPTSFNNIPCSISTKWFIRELKRLFTCFVILRWRTKVPALEGNDEEYTSNRNRKPFWFLLSGSFLRQPSWRSESDCFQSTSRIDIDWGR